jgi:hypothetical protein
MRTMNGETANLLGMALAKAYYAYTFALLMATPVHLLVAVGLLYQAIRRRPLGRRAHLLIDIIYGLANPVLYLLVLERVAARSPSPALTSLGVAVLLAFWGLRLAGRAFRPLPARAIARAVLTIGVGSVACFLARDLTLNESIAGLPLLPFTPLYSVPILSAALHLSAASDATWEGGDLLLPWNKPVRLFGALAAGLIFFSLVVSHWHSSVAVTQNLVLQYRASIEAAAEKYGIEPRLLAALVYVTHREHSNPFRRTLEEAAMTAWLSDKTSHDGLSLGLDISVGLAQIKPVTALTAMAIRFRCAGEQVGPIKHFRDIPPTYRANPIAPEVCVVARDARREVVGPPLPNDSGKDAVVAALLDPSKNLEFAAFILSTYATQWERTPGAAVIRNRPDILATLYQIGFEHSRPKANPTANDFGRQVLAAANEAWNRASFAPAEPAKEVTKNPPTPPATTR